jgi:hypothetical protein
MISNLFTALALIAAGQGNPPQPNESYVPNVRSEGIETWAADGDRGVYILSRDGNWYYALMANRCRRLRSATSITFDSLGPDRLDRHSTLIVDGWRCPIDSIVRSETPITPFGRR